MCIDFDGHHSGGSSFDMIFLFCYKMWAIPTGTSLLFKKKKKNQVKSPSPESRGNRFGSAKRVGPGFGA